DVTTADVDGDGRLDLVYRPYVKRAESVFGFTLEYADGDLAFLAHSLPSGDFAVDDVAAQRFAARTCPASAAPIVARGDAGVDFEETAHRAACARVHGSTAGDVLAEVGRACASWVPKRPSGVSGTCPDWVAAFAKVAPPLVLP